MKKSFLYNLAIAASLSGATVSCTSTSTNPTTSTAPSAIASATPTVVSTPSASVAPKPSVTATANPKPSTSPEPAISNAPKTEKVPDIVRIAVVNNSGKVLKAIYMSAPQKEDWGENELDAPLKDREKADFEWNRSSYTGDDAGCIFDIKAEYADGKVAELDPIDVCKTPAINLK
jgi:hypothetical protein